MRLEQLLYFVESVEHASISVASANLYVSHQTISKALKQLEDELHVKLLKRTKNGVVLTPEGVLIYQYAKNILATVEQIRQSAALSQDFADADRNISGIVKIIAAPAFNFMLLSTIKEINLRYPNITVLYNCLEPSHINELLQHDSSQADIFFTNIDQKTAILTDLQSKNYITILKTDNLKVYVKKGSPLSNYSVFSLKTLMDIPLALYNTNHEIKPLFLQMLQNVGFKSKRIVFSNSVDVIQNYLYDGSTISISTMLTQKRPLGFQDTSKCMLIPIKADLSVFHAAAIPRNTSRTQAMAVFLDILNRSCAETKDHPVIWY